MSDMTVKQLAEQLKIDDINKFIKQLQDAGIDAGDENSPLSSREKLQLVTYLRQQHSKPVAKKVSTTNTKKEPTKPTPSQPPEKKLSASQIAKQLAEKKRQQQGNDLRESEQEKKEQTAKANKERIEKEAEFKKQRAIDQKKKQEETREKAEKQEKQRKLELETKQKAHAERLKNLDKEAALNAQQEFDKQLNRDLIAAKDKEADELARKQADEEYKKQIRVEQMGASKFRENKKEIRKEQKKKKQAPFSVNNKHKFEKPHKQTSTEVALPETITVGDLAQKANKKSAELIMILMKMGSMVTINQVLDRDTATLLLEEMGIKYSYINENEAEEALIDSIEKQFSDEKARAPIVTIMGHVDHGKTSLLDYIRSTRVTAKEAGGITQHIGSYHVQTPNGIITFLDTPGHAAFTAMRARGAKVTDIVVIVVAADDGIMPQTIEAIQHAKAAKAPIIIAINKMDKPEADSERIKSELTQHDIVPEDWGGDVMIAHVSAKTGNGIDELLEKILLESEVLELTAPFKGPAKGIIIESRVDKGRGVVASVLIHKGALQKGDFVLSGMEYGRVRAMNDENGKPTDEAGPSIPVEILGLSGAPKAGDELITVENEKIAKELANKRHIRANEIKLARQQKAKLENLFANVGDNQTAEVNVLIKTDVQGSAEALRESLLKLSTEEVVVKVVSATVGGITESDINLAIASQAIIIGFNVRAESGAKRLAEQESIELHYYSIIYEAIEDIKQAMIGKLSPAFKEEIVGIAEVREVFKAPKIGQIAGSMVVDGYVKKANPIRVLRDNVVIYEGELESLRRFKDDVNEVRAGTECGIGVKNYNDVKVGDHIECYERKEITREL